MNNKVVYRHRRLDTFEVFYVGLGDKKRAYNKKARSNYWKNIVNKAGYEVEIIASNLSKEDACELEILLIQEYGRLDLNTGLLINLTDGGEGLLNVTEETRLKMSINTSGENNPMFGKRFYGKDNHNFGKKWSQKQRDKATAYLTGREVHNEETRAKMSLDRSGDLNPRAKILLNLNTGIYYTTIKDACASVGMFHPTFTRHLKLGKVDFIFV